jgi:hypothetical protein
MNKERVENPTVPIPTVFRNARGQVRWSMPGYTETQNQEVGIRNLQALFIERIPEAQNHFSLVDQTCLAVTDPEAIKGLILEKVGDQEKFRATFGSTPMIRDLVPYFGGTYITALKKGFESWGISFKITDFRLPHGFWKGKAKQEVIECCQILIVERSPEIEEIITKMSKGEEVDKEALKKYLLDLMGSKERMVTVLPTTLFNSKQIPYFGSSYKVILEEIAAAWGVEISDKDIKRAELRNVEGTQLNIPKNSKGKIRWNLLTGDPDLLLNVIEQEALALIDSGTPLTQHNLITAGLTTLSNYIWKYYPGSFLGLRKKLGNEEGRKPRSYWSSEDGLEHIRKEVRTFYEEHGNISNNYLTAHNRQDLINAITKYYPGGWFNLRADIGLPLEQNQRGSWTYDRIRTEAQGYLREVGEISHKSLLRNGRSDLSHAIQRYYPGGWVKLKTDLGEPLSKKQKGYWDMEQVEQEAIKILQEYSLFDTSLLRRLGKVDLLTAIPRKYPGGMRALQEMLGLREKTISAEEADEDLKKLLQ